MDGRFGIGSMVRTRRARFRGWEVQLEVRSRDALREQFARDGYIGPRRIVPSSRCRRFLDELRRERRPSLDWGKGHAATSRVFFEMATHPAILDIVSGILGEEFMLWGASVVARGPGSVHPWHSDIESCLSPGGTVSVWLGLEGVSRASSLQVIPGSHRYGVTVQQVRTAAGVGLDGSTAEAVAGWASERDPDARLVVPEMADGDAIFFDGRLWHGTDNRSDVTRQALLLQYALPDTPIRIPDYNHLDWPFVQLDEPRPPCIMMRGSTESDANEFVGAPVARVGTGNTELTSRIHPLDLPLGTAGEEAGWKPYPQFRGSTAALRHLSCHVSALEADRVPHEPHRHKDEELLIVLGGEVDILLPEVQEDWERGIRLSAGDFVYYPSGFLHTLRGVSERPANYLMFRWHGEREVPGTRLGYGRFGAFGGSEDESVRKADPTADDDGLGARVVFEGATRFLRKLHCHVTTLAPGSGYDPHVDAYDVGIVLLEGEVETLGQKLGPHGAIFYRAGEPHGMHNPGSVPARYLVFEFHGHHAPPSRAGREVSLLEKVLDPKRWRRKLKRLLGRG